MRVFHSTLLVVSISIFSWFVYAQQVYGLKFGTVQRDGTIYSFDQEMNVLPIISGDIGFYFGLAIHPPNDDKYKVSLTLTFPEVPKQLTGILAEKSIEMSEHSIVFPPYMLEGDSVIPMAFDSDDPAGEYVLDISINGKLVDTVIFHAVIAGEKER